MIEFHGCGKCFKSYGHAATERGRDVDEDGEEVAEADERKGDDRDNDDHHDVGFSAEFAVEECAQQDGDNGRDRCDIACEVESKHARGADDPADERAADPLDIVIGLIGERGIVGSDLLIDGRDAVGVQSYGKSVDLTALEVLRIERLPAIGTGIRGRNFRLFEKLREPIKQNGKIFDERSGQHDRVDE